MEVCPEAELIASEDPATVFDRAFQIGKGLEVAVRERLIQNGPEVLGGLKLGRVRGQVDEPEALRLCRHGSAAVRLAGLSLSRSVPFRMRGDRRGASFIPAGQPAS